MPHQVRHDESYALGMTTLALSMTVILSAAKYLA
jgi:hypothetical protein